MHSTNIAILSSMRALAALSVCLFHFVCTTTGYFQSETLLGIFDAGQYGVQLFFVISGFVIPWSMYHAGYQLRNFFGFFLKRLARLEPPYVVSLLLAIALLMLRSEMVEGAKTALDAKQVGLHFFYLVPFFEGYKWLNGVYWTLAIEFQYYIFIALVFTALVYGNIFVRVLMYAAMLGAAFLTDTRFLPHWLPFFLLGILLFLYKVRKVDTMEFALATLITLVFCFLHYPVFACVYAMLPVAAVLFFSDRKIPVLNYIGEFSYSIYLVHTLIGASVINVLSHRFTASWEKPLVILAGLAATLLSSLLMYYVVERPSKKLSGRIRYRR